MATSSRKRAATVHGCAAAWLAALLAGAGCGAAGIGSADGARGEPPAWPDTAVARLEATALLRTFEAELLGGGSATTALEHWCAVHRLAGTAKIVAERIANVDKAPSPQQIQDLRITPGEQIKYRRVRLKCGKLVLSEADNWYVPARLTAEMNRRLDTTDEPFGSVVKALRFERRTLSSSILWRPLPDNWEMAAADAHDGSGTRRALAIPAQVLTLRAVLAPPGGMPFSEVVETYTGGILAFAPHLPHVVD